MGRLIDTANLYKDIRAMCRSKFGVLASDIEGEINNVIASQPSVDPDENDEEEAK